MEDQQSLDLKVFCFIYSQWCGGLMLGLKNKISSPLTVYYIDFFNVHYQQDCGLCAYLHLVFSVKFPSCTSNHVIYYQLNANCRNFKSEFYPHACTHGLSSIFVFWNSDLHSSCVSRYHS